MDNLKVSASSPAPEEIIDLQRYPIADLAAPAGKALVKRCQDDLRRTGACVLAGFITPEATTAMAFECQELAPLAYHNELVANAYLSKTDDSLPPDHARRITDRTALGAVAYDQIPEDNTLRVIFEWPVLTDFIGAAINRGKLYHYACPLGALNVSVMKDQDYLRWHFDQGDFVASIPIQNALSGGEFEFVHNIRSATDENYDAVKAVLQGGREAVETLITPPGSLILFEGRYTLHRVTEIHGAKLRLMGLLGYALAPDVTSDAYLRRIRYGREG